MLFGLGAQPVAGLDIGSSSVKFVEAERRRSGWVVKRYANVPLPEDTIVDGEVVNHAALVEAIKTAVKESGSRAKQITASIAGSSVIIKHIAIPITKPAEVEDQVYWEAEQYIPFSISEISLDYEVVRENNGEGKMDILLVAAKKDFIEKRLAAVRETGLEPAVLEVDAFALANVYWENYDMAPESSVVLVDVGASLTKINIIDAKTTLFTRDVGVGGRNLTQEIQNKMGISFQEAEVLKVDSSISGQIPDELAPVFNTITEGVAMEVRRSLDFYAASPHQLPVTGVFLSGGSSRIPGLVNVLSEMLGLPVDFLNPFNKVEFSAGGVDEAAITSVATIPVGLALREEEH
jgi:type IV pilus assembly protein PilM